MSRPPANTPVDAECASCKHSPAYHDGEGGHVCRAWDPEEPNFFCACKGWKAKPKPAPAPTTLICDSENVRVEPVVEPEAMPWDLEQIEP